MHKSLDVKSQSWTHACDILIVKFFQYGSLSGVVQSATSSLIYTPVCYAVDDSQKQKSHFLLL